MGHIFKAFNLLKLISYLQVGSLWILLVAVPFHVSTTFTRCAMITAGVFFLMDYIANRRWCTWSWSHDKWLYVAMIVYYIYIPLWQIGSDTYDARHFSYIMESHLSMLLGGLIGIMGFSERVKLRHIACVMLVSCLFSSFYIIFKSEGFAFFTHLPSEQAEIFTLSRIRWVNSHMIYNLFLNISLVFAFYLLREENLKLPIKICVTAACAWIFYLLCLTEGRIGLFTGLLLGASFLLIYTYRRGLKWFLPVIAVYIFAGALIISQHERFESDMIEQEPRQFIWQATVDIINEKPIIGHGVCDAKKMLTEKSLVGEGDLQDFYRPKITDRTIHKLPHPHNAFLQAWCNFGIIGLATILFIFIFPLTLQSGKNRIYIYMTVGCFMIQSMTDLFFTPQPLLYCLSIMFFASKSNITKQRYPKNENRCCYHMG